MEYYSLQQKSLKEIGLSIAYGEDPMTLFDNFLKNLVAEKINISPEVYSQEPFILDDICRAYIGGLAEYLAQMSGNPPPEWCHKSIYFLKFPVFLTQTPRDILLANTPSAFRRRLIFCGDAISLTFKS
jgi:hypothetical protein